MAFVVGVDGCKLGWVAVALKDGAFASAAIYKSLISIPAVRTSAAAIAVDIPTGLTDAKARDADVAVRAFLGNERLPSFSCRPAKSLPSAHGTTLVALLVGGETLDSRSKRSRSSRKFARPTHSLAMHAFMRFIRKCHSQFSRAAFFRQRSKPGTEPRSGARRSPASGSRSPTTSEMLAGPPSTMSLMLRLARGLHTESRVPPSAVSQMSKRSAISAVGSSASRRESPRSRRARRLLRSQGPSSKSCTGRT